MDIVISIPKILFEPAFWFSLLAGIGTFAFVQTLDDENDVSFFRGLVRASVLSLAGLCFFGGGLGSIFLLTTILSQPTSSASIVYYFFYYSLVIITVIGGSMGAGGLFLWFMNYLGLLK